MSNSAGSAGSAVVQWWCAGFPVVPRWCRPSVASPVRHPVGVTMIQDAQLLAMIAREELARNLSKLFKPRAEFVGENMIAATRGEARLVDRATVESLKKTSMKAKLPHHKFTAAAFAESYDIIEVILNGKKPSDRLWSQYRLTMAVLETPQARSASVCVGATVILTNGNAPTDESLYNYMAEMYLAEHPSLVPVNWTLIADLFNAFQQMNGLSGHIPPPA